MGIAAVDPLVGVDDVDGSNAQVLEGLSVHDHAIFGFVAGGRDHDQDAISAAGGLCDFAEDVLRRQAVLVAADEDQRAEARFFEGH